MRLPGCKKLRGTQVGVRRSNPPPASRAEERDFSTLSLLRIAELTIAGPRSLRKMFAKRRERFCFIRLVRGWQATRRRAHPPREKSGHPDACPRPAYERRGTRLALWR